VFLINSRHPLVCAPTPWLPKMGPLLPKLRSNLPSSFNIVLSSALVYSTSPPVSVSGTVYVGAISWNPSLPPNPISLEQLTDPSLTTGPGILTVVPIDYAFRPRLRGRLTLRRLTCAGTLGLSATVSLTLFVVTHVSILTSDTSSRPHGSPSQAYGTLRYRLHLLEPAASVHGLSPVTFSAQDGLSRPVSCYAFFKGWLLLSQPPGCLGFPHPFPLSHDLGTLAGGQGCFPLDDGR
jgi:hypothetical protein